MAFKKTQIADAEITRKKFQREISAFEKNEPEWRKKGVVRLNTNFPKVEFLFCAIKSKPQAVAFAIEIDFTNYDLYPPSLRFLNPFSGEMIRAKDMDIQFVQIERGFLPNGQMHINQRSILMGAENDYPFICLPGVREYHQHPAHTGDSWFLYRTLGEGRLNWLLDQLYKHSTAFPIQYHLVQTVRLQQIISP